MTGTAGFGGRRDAVALAVLMVGTLLAPLNSSMVAVALYPVQQDLDASLGEVTWLVTSFYLVACVAQPVMGRVADVTGPRALFVGGMLLASAASAAAPFVTDVWALVVCRCLLAVGVSTSFPCALVLVRARGGSGQLGRIAVVNTTAGAVGPVLGGLLTDWAGWPAIFWVNLPLTVGALLVAARLLPGRARGPRADAVPAAGVDVIGVLFFAAGMLALLRVMLTLPRADTVSVAVAAVTLTAFVVWETRCRAPFVDVSALWSQRGLVPVLAIFVLFNLTYYSAFYGLPQWFQGTLGLDAAAAGLLVLPIAATSVVATVAGARALRVSSPEQLACVSALLLLVGVAVLLAFDASTPRLVVVLAGVLLGVPYGLGNLVMQHQMYDRAPAGLTGLVGGLFQSARYTGAILAVGLVGACAPSDPSAAADLTTLTLAMTVVAVLVAVAVVADAVLARRRAAAIRWAAPSRTVTGSRAD
ncbi:MFS transporter [Rhodococcus jostii]|uniref:MFS transporter n=1 Tax=Rhodococcus jostii TaxID=132919 RepID=A0ABU4CRH1_RHOJO|nr:MFS transporter [Rhodococcus jostii]MDV6285833.1 MFS transporter [Rhodococcus jostii]